jgi:hypothetical protein
MENPKPIFTRFSSFLLVILCFGGGFAGIALQAHKDKMAGETLIFLFCLTLFSIFLIALFRLRKYEFFDRHLLISFPLRTYLPKNMTLYKKRSLELKYSEISQVRYYVPVAARTEPSITFYFVHPETKKFKGWSLIIYNKKKARELLALLKPKGLKIVVDTPYPKDKDFAQG